MTNFQWALVLIVSISLPFSARGEVRPNTLFSDNAVFQRGTPIPVWGTAGEGEKVTVSFDGQERSTTAKEGKWMVSLPAHAEGGPYELTISGANTNRFTNILVGEVWVCSGQSNMERQLGPRKGQKPLVNSETEIASADYPKLRMFTVKQKVSPYPETESVGQWVVCSPSTVAEFSAVGYYFGRDLLKATGVPVGMIHSSWGGTQGESWMSYEGLQKNPETKFFTDSLDARVADYIGKLDQYREVLEKFHTLVGTNSASVRELRTLPPSGPVSPFGSPNIPTMLYNGMIAPLIPYAMRGVIWYQGENNARTSKGAPDIPQCKLYRTLFPTLIADWRSKWGLGDFPFLYVQIAPFKGMPPEIREAQLMTLEKATNTAMTVITDHGDAQDIHPPEKEPVGQRLALAARALAYGEKIEFSGPLYDTLKINGNRTVISFRHKGTGLFTKDGELKGFTIAGADGKFLPAKAEIIEDTVVVSSDQVSAPVAVRYGWSDVPDVNLFNKEGLPASPFRTDSQ
jgi:sialate O-acetylesterase